MQKTSGEIEKEFIDNLHTSTGKDLGGWLKEIGKSGIAKRNEIIVWLKTRHGFGHMNASLLAGIHANGGKPVYGDIAELLENQFAKAEAMRPAYHRLIALVRENFPDCTVIPKKTYVSIVGRREFAAVNIKRNELRLGLDLGDRPFDGLVGKAKLTGPMPRISHQIVIGEEDTIAGRVIDLLRESFARSN